MLMNPYKVLRSTVTENGVCLSVRENADEKTRGREGEAACADMKQ